MPEGDSIQPPQPTGPQDFKVLGALFFWSGPGQWFLAELPGFPLAASAFRNAASMSAVTLGTGAAMKLAKEAFDLLRAESPKSGLLAQIKKRSG